MKLTKATYFHLTDAARKKATSVQTEEMSLSRRHVELLLRVSRGPESLATTAAAAAADVHEARRETLPCHFLQRMGAGGGFPPPRSGSARRYASRTRGPGRPGGCIIEKTAEDEAHRGGGQESEGETERR